MRVKWEFREGEMGVRRDFRKRAGQRARGETGLTGTL